MNKLYLHVFRYIQNNSIPIIFKVIIDKKGDFIEKIQDKGAEPVKEDSDINKTDIEFYEALMAMEINCSTWKFVHRFIGDNCKKQSMSYVHFSNAYGIKPDLTIEINDEILSDKELKVLIDTDEITHGIFNMLPSSVNDYIDARLNETFKMTVITRDNNLKNNVYIPSNLELSAEALQKSIVIEKYEFKAYNTNDFKPIIEPTYILKLANYRFDFDHGDKDTMVDYKFSDVNVSYILSESYLNEIFQKDYIKLEFLDDFDLSCDNTTDRIKAFNENLNKIGELIASRYKSIINYIILYNIKYNSFIDSEKRKININDYAKVDIDDMPPRLSEFYNSDILTTESYKAMRLAIATVFTLNNTGLLKAFNNTDRNMILWTLSPVKLYQGLQKLKGDTPTLIPMSERKNLEVGDVLYDERADGIYEYCIVIKKGITSLNRFISLNIVVDTPFPKIPDDIIKIDIGTDIINLDIPMSEISYSYVTSLGTSAVTEIMKRVRKTVVKLIKDSILNISESYKYSDKFDNDFIFNIIDDIDFSNFYNDDEERG